jgi:hypothetical protein
VSADTLALEIAPERIGYVYGEFLDQGTEAFALPFG